MPTTSICKTCVGADMNSYFHQFITELEQTIESEDQRGFFLQAPQVDSKKARVKGEEYIRGEDSVLLRIYKTKFVVGGVRFFSTL